jgi:arsenate reductase
MAEAFLKSFDPNGEVFSAGTKPEAEVNPNSIIVMTELGLEIKACKPKSVDIFLNEEFDYVVTVCDKAKETCPVFLGKVKNRLHIGFDDPAAARGTEEEILNQYRLIRDQIEKRFRAFWEDLQK